MEQDRQMEQADDRLLTGARTTHMEVELLAETLQQGEHLIQENKWGEEGWQIILAYGVGFLKGERTLADLAASETTPADVLRRCVTLDSMYSAMKYRAYCLTQDNKVLGFHTAGLRSEVETFHLLVKLMRTQIAVLKEENQRLSGLLAETQPPDDAITVSDPVQSPMAPASRSRLSGLVQRLAAWTSSPGR